MLPLTASGWHRAAATFWRESYLELRRRGGDERLPSDVRRGLRSFADHALRRAASAERRAFVPHIDRHALAADPPVRLAPGPPGQAAAFAAEVGLDSGPLVALEVRTREDLLGPAVGALAEAGYRIARIGDTSIGPIHLGKVVDVTAHPGRPPSFDAYLIEQSVFVICASAEVQHAATLADVPCLRLDAPDPFAAYPIRGHGLFTLAAVIDLDTGRPLDMNDRLTSAYFRNLRNLAHRPSPAATTENAVREMIESLQAGWSESAAQAAFRVAVIAAGLELSGVSQVVEAGAASGFVGQGRLAQVQARAWQ